MMSTIYDDPMLSLKGLADKSGIKADRLSVWSALPDFPSRMHGKRKRILWSDFCAWDWEHHGPGGDSRGGEDCRINL
jgi:hypothetical protein